VGERRLDINALRDLGGGEDAVLPAEVLAVPPAYEPAGEEGHAAGDQGDLGAGGEIVALELQAPGVHEVVGVHAGDERSAGLREAEVEGGHEADAAGAQQAGPGVVAGVRGNKGRRLVRRAVVHGEQLVVAEGLPPDGGEAGGQGGRGVAEGHEDGDGGLCHGAMLLRSGAGVKIAA
jgi:hypothetical protein